MLGLSPNSTVASIPATDMSDAKRELPLAYYILETILALCAFLGNSCILLLFVLEPKLRLTVSNVHLISLALSDLCMGTITIPILLVALRGLPHQFPACITLLSCVILIDVASVFALLTMTLDRYYSITRPLRYRVRVTRSRAAWAALVSWLLAGLIVLPMPLGWHHAPSEPRCYFVKVVSMQYMTYVFFLSILVPFVVMCFVYIRIYRIIQKQLKQIQALHDIAQRLHMQCSWASKETRGIAQNLPGTGMHSRDAERAERAQPQAAHSPPCPDNFHRIKREMKTAGFFTFLVLFFFATWMPIFLVDALLHFGVNVRQDVVNSCVLLSHANSALNPLLYTLKADFRAAFRQKIFPVCLHSCTNAVHPTVINVAQLTQ